MPRNHPFVESAAAFAFLVGSAVGSPAALAEDERGLLGIRYRAIEEGLVVTGVSAGMGAEAAGLQVGSLVVAADGTSFATGAVKPRTVLTGPPGSTVELSVIPPLGANAVDLTVERRAFAGESGRSVAMRPAVVLSYRRAVRDASRRKAVAAAQAMVEANFGGMAPSKAVGASLATAKRRGERFARDVATALAVGAEDDPYLLQGLGRVLLNTGEPEAARVLLERRATLLPPDLTLADGSAADVGGSFQARALLIDAQMEMGDRTAATEASRRLFATHRDPAVAALTGMAIADPTATWTANLPPVAPFSVPLLDGSTWTSADHLGSVVVVNFWATWCGPCKRELPELAELYDARKEEGVEILAVSTDEGPIESVQKMAEQLKLPFSVGRHPELSSTFAVSALPSIRVLGPGGALHYSAKGFSDGAMEKLDQAIDLAMEAGDAGGAPLATVWGPAAEQLSLRTFFPVAGAQGVAAHAGGVLVGAVEASPTTFTLDGSMTGEASVAVARGQPGARMGWLDGAVAADPGKLVVRKWDPDGLSQWVRILPEPVIDLVTASGAVWVAGLENLYVLDGNGNLLHTHPVGLTDLVVSSDRQSVNGIGPDARVSGQLHTTPAASLPAPSGEEPAPVDAQEAAPKPARPSVEIVVEQMDSVHHVLSEDGDAAGTVVNHIASGRFGPGGERRVAVVRGDDRLILLRPDGQVDAVVELRRAGPMAVVDVDGDGTDSLLVTIPDHGVALLEWSTP